jgi:hypothetical protein
MNQGKALRLACLNTDGVRGIKFELEHFIKQQGVEIYQVTHSLTLAKPTVLPIMSTTAQRD